MNKALIDLPSSLVVQVQDTTFEVDAAHAWVDCPDYVQAGRYTYENGQFNLIPEPEPIPPTAEENKQTAVQLLQSTDWTTIADVSDPAISSPYLANAQEFISYRNAVRQYAVYPVAGFLNWPVKPQEVWS